jgi:hypothetical protein
LYVARVEVPTAGTGFRATAKKSVISPRIGCGLDPSGLFSFTGFSIEPDLEVDVAVVLQIESNVSTLAAGVTSQKPMTGSPSPLFGGRKQSYAQERRIGRQLGRLDVLRHSGHHGAREDERATHRSRPGKRSGSSSRRSHLRSPSSSRPATR